MVRFSIKLLLEENVRLILKVKNTLMSCLNGGDSYVIRHGAVVPWWLICVYFYTKTILYEHYSILDLSIPSPLGKESFRLPHSIFISRSSFVLTYIHRAVIIIASKPIGASNGNTHSILKKILLTNISHIALKSR